MTKEQAKKLKIGDRVEIFPGTEHACEGSVVETGYCAVKFKWDDETFGVIHVNDMANVHRARATATAA